MPKRVRVEHVQLEAASVRTATGMFSRRRLSGGERVAQLGERRAGGERTGDGSEDVAAVEGRRTGSRRSVEPATSTASATPPSRSRDRHQQAVVGADQQAPLLDGAQGDGAAAARAVVPTPGSTTARMIASGR